MTTSLPPPSGAETSSHTYSTVNNHCITPSPTSTPAESSQVRTEDTALTPEGRRRSLRRSSRRRRSSVAERLIHAMVQRAFSISGPDNENNDYNPASMEEEEEEYYHDNEMNLDGSYERPKPRMKNRTWSCLQRNACCFVVVIVILGLTVTMAVLIGTKNKAWSLTHSTTTNNGSCTSLDRNAVLTLKESATLEGLQHGAVASDHQVCSQVGSDILERGGNAVDAAVATVLCLGVANPASSGLGGGAFMLIHSSRSNFERKDPALFPDFIDAREEGTDNEHDPYMTEVIDCRETAPEHSSRDMYSGLADSASAIGPLAIAVPGELKGMELAHARHGKLPWTDVVEPARRLAEDGVKIGGHLAQDIKGVITKYFPKYGDFPALRSFLTRNGSTETYLREGDILNNPNLAKTLQQVAEGGADAFYKGDNASNLVNEVQKAGGIITVRDMEGYKATLRSPLHADVSGFTVVGVPPPSSGGAVLIGAARFLSGYKTPLAATADTLSMHRLVEAMRHAFSIRMSLSDPSFNSDVTRDAVNDLMSGDYMESLRLITKDNSTLGISQYGGVKWSQMNDDDSMQEVQDAHEGDRRRGRERQRRLARPFGYLDDNGTSHLSVVDKDGNAVAVTSSVNGIFGSWIFSETTGVLMGNTMDDFGVPGRSNFFGLKPSEANFIYPGKKVRTFCF
jgi:gamma-glutamyltranspeptidase